MYNSIKHHVHPAPSAHCPKQSLFPSPSPTYPALPTPPSLRLSPHCSLCLCVMYMWGFFAQSLHPAPQRPSPLTVSVHPMYPCLCFYFVCQIPHEYLICSPSNHFSASYNTGTYANLDLREKEIYFLLFTRESLKYLAEKKNELVHVIKLVTEAIPNTSCSYLVGSCFLCSIFCIA